MADLITTLTARIEEYRADNKNPCKNYGSKVAAEKATHAMAVRAALCKGPHRYRGNSYPRSLRGVLRGSLGSLGWLH